jgi:hypothetical protein
MTFWTCRGAPSPSCASYQTFAIQNPPDSGMQRSGLACRELHRSIPDPDTAYAARAARVHQDAARCGPGNGALALPTRTEDARGNRELPVYGRSIRSRRVPPCCSRNVSATHEAITTRLFRGSYGTVGEGRRGCPMLVLTDSGAGADPRPRPQPISRPTSRSGMPSRRSEPSVCEESAPSLRYGADSQNWPTSTGCRFQPAVIAGTAPSAWRSGTRSEPG